MSLWWGEMFSAQSAASGWGNYLRRVSRKSAATIVAAFAVAAVSELTAAMILQCVIAPRVVDAQSSSPERGAAALGGILAGLGTTGRVLTIGAHPDDEDTQFIAWLARGRHVETAYLSLTRGDGGQNLIGNELGELLGVVRTQELMSARRIDGGRQYFTRAYDFGFSKTADETFDHWPHDSILGDVVRVVRAFRPQVMVAFFTGTPRDGHGHHQASGILAREAYDAAADTVQFPVATYGAAWTPLKFYRSARSNPEAATLRMNVGEYDPLLGRSYYEIAAESRSQHKSQGFGVLQRKGAIEDAITREQTRVNVSTPASQEKGLFDGIDTTWARLGKLAANSNGNATSNANAAVNAASQLDSANAYMLDARRSFRASNPTAAVGPLAKALRLVRAASPVSRDNSIATTELNDALSLTAGRLQEALTLAAGVAVEAIAPTATFPVRESAKKNVNDSLPVEITVFNRGEVSIGMVDANIDPIGARGASTGKQNVTDLETDHAPGTSFSVQRYAVAFAPTTSWWRDQPRVGDLFSIPIGNADELTHEARTAVNARVRLNIAGENVDVVVPVVYRFADPVKGDQQVAVNAVPGITIGLGTSLQYIRAGAIVEREFHVNVRSAYAGPATVTVSIQLPDGLKADSVSRTRVLTPDAPQASLVFKTRGTVAEGRLQMGVVAIHENRTSITGYYTIDYDHITLQREYSPSGMWLQAVDVKLPTRAHVGYIAGVGDAGLEALQELDVPVEPLDPAALPTTDLSRFTSIVLGPRAYEASKVLTANNAKLLEYARKGGTLVVQYGQYEMMRPGIMPYPIELSRPAERVTLEKAPVNVTSPGADLLNRPNKISPSDWENWVQERATYMPSKIAPEYRTFVSMHDPNEPPNSSGLLQANLGRGSYRYVTLALFRQLPNGVPGAARLLVNLITPSASPATAPKP